MLKMSFKSDYDFGTKKEVENLEKLNKFFKTKLKQNEDKFGLFDYISEDKKILVELKSRRVKHNQYPTALIGANKIDSIEDKEDVEAYLCFCYLDGLFYLKYDKEVFSKITKKDFTRYERSDYDDLPKLHYFIPYELMTKIEDDVDDITKLLSVNFII